MKAEELIRQYYHHLCEGSWEAILPMLDSAVIHEFNQSQPTRGVEAFKEFLIIKNRHYKEKIEDLLILVDPSGQRAAAEFVLRGHYLFTYPELPLAHGQPYKLRVGAFFNFRNEKISRLTTYFNFELWLSQVSK